MTDKKKYTTASGFRMALEERLKNRNKETGIELMRLRRQIAFDRFLARIFSDDMKGLITKGGYALELRLEHARATKDIDFTFTGNLNGIWTGDPEDLQSFLNQKAEIDLKDFFVYAIGKATLDLENAVYGGFRFPVEALMDGRRFASFNIDIAGGDAWIEPHDTLMLHDWLEFAGIPVVEIPVISLEQQFAEKLHSYTLERKNPNSRVKDIVDLVLLVERCTLDIGRLRDAIAKTFNRRKTHEIPEELDNPPESWRDRFEYIAIECGISGDIDAAIMKVREYYKLLF